MLLKLKRRKLTKTEEKPTKTKRPGRGWRRLARFLIITPFVLFAIGLAAYFYIPVYLLNQMNEKVGNMPGYIAHIESLDVNFFTATAVAKKIVIKKRGGKIDVPVLYVNKSTVRLDKEAYTLGKYNTLILVDTLSINVIKGATAELSQGPGDTTLSNLLKVMMPLTRNRLEVLHGDIHYTDNTKSPILKLDITELYVLGENLANVKDSTALLPAKIHVEANLYGGQMVVNMKLNALSKLPLFDMTASIKNLPLVNVNSILRTYAKFDVHKGTFNMYAELASKNNRIVGYVKPVVTDLDIYDKETEKNEDRKTKNREKWIDFGAWLFKNKKEDKLSVKIEIDGPLKNPNVNIWQVIDDAINDSVNKSILSGVDNSVDINSTPKEHKKTLLEKVFGKKEKKPKSEKRKTKK